MILKIRAFTEVIILHTKYTMSFVINLDLNLCYNLICEYYLFNAAKTKKESLFKNSHILLIFLNKF